MKQFLIAFLALTVFAGCMSKGQVAKVSLSQNYHKGAPMRVLVLPFEVEGNPDMQINDSYSELLSGTLIGEGFVTVDVNTAMMKAGMSSNAMNTVYNPDMLSKLTSAVGADAILQGSITCAYVPPSSGTTPSSVARTRNDSTKKSTVTYTGASSYSSGGYFAEQTMSLRMVNARSGDVLVSAYLNDKDITGYLNSSASYLPINELSEALKRNLK